jgi:hypothetical protein
MAKQKPQRGEKSSAIRELLAQDPHIAVKDIVSTLAGRGLKVDPNLVYAIKAKGKARRRKQKRQQAVEAGRNSGMSNPVALVLKVRQLAGEAGGLKHLKQLVDVLAE